MQQKIRILIIITGLTIMGFGVWVIGGIIIIEPIKILPSAYSLIYIVLIFLASLLLSIRSVRDLMSRRIDFSKISRVSDPSLFRFYKLILYLSVFSVALATFINSILFR